MRPLLGHADVNEQTDPTTRADDRGPANADAVVAAIPSTTALATINKIEGRELGLMRGANIVMPNLTPPEYRVKYEIYPDKACVNETAEMCRGCLQGRVKSIGRVIGDGPGGRRST